MSKEVAKLTSISKDGFFKHMNQTYMKHINESKLLIGMVMIMLNIGAKYVDLKFSKTQEQMLRNGVAREMLIFAVVFMGTRDIFYAILLTSAFIILSEFVLNDKSKYCMMPKKMKQISALIDTNQDGIISPEEESKALEVLQKAELGRKKDMNGKFNTYLQNMNMNTLSGV